MNQALLQNAFSQHQAGNLTEAARLYGEVLRQNPKELDALAMLGLLHGQQGEIEQAARLADAAAGLLSRSSRTEFNLGCLLENLGRHEEAIARFDRALALQPSYAAALGNRGIALSALGRHEEARTSFEASLKQAPFQPDALFRLCGEELVLGRHAEALASIERYLARWPENAEAWVSRGSAYMGLRDFENAGSSFAKAVELTPENLIARSSHAAMLLAQNRYEEALAAFRALRERDANFPYAIGNSVECQLRICDWSRLAEDVAAAQVAVAAGLPAIRPFMQVAISRRQAEQLSCARIEARVIGAGIERLPPAPPYRHDRIRVAYLSEDFCGHAVSYLMAGVWEQHDRTRFEVTALSYSPDDGSEMGRRVRGAFEHVIDIRGMTDAEVAQAMREREIDIAVDLMGYTGNARRGILARHAAPLQVNFLGFPSTTGADYIDYILADRVVIPPDDRVHFSESVAYLPHSYLPADNRRKIAEEGPTRAALGLPEHGFVFCCFNAAMKFTPEIFAIWMRLLGAVDNSVLWISELGPSPVRNLRERAAAHGIAPERIVVAPFEDAQEHYLARVRLADLFLDTLPYNAHTTASDALWAGVPVLTCRGSCFAGRVAASVLSAAGMPELIAESLESYEVLARNLAMDRGRLAGLRAKLLAQRGTHPLFDTARFARNLEAAYVAMWERQQRGEVPASFDVSAVGQSRS